MQNSDDTIPKRIRAIAEKFPHEDCLYTKDANGVFQMLPYKELLRKVRCFGTGLLEIGVKRGEHIGIISDNREEWIVADLSILGLGAVDVPRGSDSTEEEIAYILGHADCPLAFAEDETQLKKILSKKDRLPILSAIIVMDRAFDPSAYGNTWGVKILTYAEVMDLGQKLYAEKPDAFDAELEKGKGGDLATLIYTSGTTGEPKGVMLTHQGFIFQIDRVDRLTFSREDIFLSVLPIWHSFERAVQYVILSRAGAVAYSKPIGKVLIEDMQKMRPTWMTAVPRLWEGVRTAVYRNINKEGGIKKALFSFFIAVGSLCALFKTQFKGNLPQYARRSRVIDIAVSIIPLIILIPLRALGNVLVYRKVKEKFGGRFKVGVSGGGALPPHVDKFYQAIGILVLEGYGLTETAPILSVREEKRPVPGTVGPFLDDIQRKVLDESGKEMKPGQKGILWVKSDQVMLGYYKRPEETQKVLQDGWLNTGDIVILTHRNEIKIIGRAKDTIVLMGGENVEPEPIENKLCQSDYIEQAMVVGQDQRFLGALIIPNIENLEQYAQSKGIAYIEKEELINKPEILELINDEVQNLVSTKTGFKTFERVFRFKLLEKKFEVGVEMTHSLKIRRNVVSEMYAKQIKQLFA